MAGKDIYRIVVINLGSTSTKVGFYENAAEVFTENISHSREEVARFAEIQDQLMYRKDLVEEAFLKKGIDLDEVDIFVGNGGGMVSCLGGVYEVNDILIEDCKIGRSGAHHPANLASQICRLFASEHDACCYTVNPPDIDELMDIARPTGLSDVFRKSSFHALNQKEIAFRYAENCGRKYEEMNLVIAHIGGGISVSAHRKGMVIDTTSAISGNGPMMPSRAGEIDTTVILDLVYSGKYDKDSIKNRLTRFGGLMDHLGTDDAREVEKRITDGDKYAKVVYDAMIYQICKHIAAMCTALKGDADQIILTGGISHSDYVTGMIRDYCGYLSGITVMAGEYEMEALAAGALRAARGEVETRTYTGEPMFVDFEYLK